MSKVSEDPRSEIDDADAAFQALAKPFSDPKLKLRSYREYVLVRISGGWVLQQSEFRRRFDEILDEKFGPDPDHADWPRVIKLC